MIPNPYDEILLADDFSTWYAAKKPVRVVNASPTSSPGEGKLVDVDTMVDLKLNDESDGQATTASSTQSSLQALTFTRFPKLPFELRAQIWRAAFPGARVIKFSCFEAFFDGCHTGILATQLLHVCRESRSETLRFYLPLIKSAGPNHSHMYINPQIDTLLVTDHYPWIAENFNIINADVLRTLRKLAVGMDSMKVLFTTNYMIDGLIHFGNLESLTLICATLTHKSWAATLNTTNSVALFDYFTKPAHEWPTIKSVSRAKYEELTTEEFQKFGYHVDMVRLQEERLCLMRVMMNLAAHNPAWKVPQVDIKGIREL